MQSTSGAPTPKEVARKLIDQLPDNASWQEILYYLEVHIDVEAGLDDIRRGHVEEAIAVRKEYGLPT